jgi:O-antigen/teichoic acid export membrane protein/capsular polysaccharide biosynthesis protein
MDLRKAAAGALAWTTLESAALSGLSLISLVVLSRYLSPREFGVAAIALGLVQLLNVPVEVFFHDVLIRHDKATESHFHSAFSATLALGVLLSGSCWLFAPWLARIMGEPMLGTVLPWMSLSLVGMAFGSTLMADQRRKLHFRALALRSLVGRATAAVVAIAMAIRGYGVWALVAQQVLLVSLGSATLWIASAWRPKLRLRSSDLRELTGFGLHSTLSTFLGLSIQRVFLLLVGGYMGSYVVGCFSLVFRVTDMLRDLMAGAVSQLALPLFARVQNDSTRLVQVYTQALRLTFFAICPIFVLVACCAHDIVAVGFGQKWTQVEAYLSISALLALPFFARVYTGPMFRAVGRAGLPNVALTLQVAYLSIAMLVFGRYAPVYAMTVWVVRVLVTTPIDVWLLKRATGMTAMQQSAGTLQPLIAAAGMAVLVLSIGQEDLQTLPALTRLFVEGAIGITSYVCLMLLMDRTLTKQFFSFLQTASGGRVDPKSIAQYAARTLAQWTPRKVLSRAAPKTLPSRQYAERFGAEWREVYGAAPSQRPLPASFGSGTGELESKLCRILPPAGVLVMRAGSIRGPEGLVVGTDDYWLPEHSWYGQNPAESRPLIGRCEPRRLEGTGLTLASNWSCENYGHLLLDSLPRIHLFTKAGFSFADVDHIYCPARNPDKAAALLARYGVPIDKCILDPLPQGGGIRFDTLIAPTFPGVRRNYPEWVPSFLRQGLPTGTRTPYRRLYITRGSGTRKVTNESALVPLLNESGFEIYDPSQHPDPWLDFSQATAVIGPHGAGLTDLAFCAAGTAVLELLPSDHVYPYYCSLSQAAGLRYGYLIGQSERQRSKRAFGPSPYDFVVNESQFAAGLHWISTVLEKPGRSPTNTWKSSGGALTAAP